jgi:subtilisin family serine protease
MRLLSTVLVLVLLSIPLAAAIDMPDRERSEWKGLKDPWSPHVEIQGEMVPWWERTTFDQNGNGISDILEPFADLENGDHIAIDLTISYSRDFDDNDIKELQLRGFDVAVPLEIIDAIAISQVPSYRIHELLNLNGVIFVEPQGNPILFADIANPTVQAKTSDMFSPWTAWDLGYRGAGVSIAVIDTGIDNEHPALDGKFLGGVDMTKWDQSLFLFPQDGSYNPDDIQGHGSTCSGIATGTGAPDGEYQGPATEAKLVDIRIGTKIGYAPGEFWVGAQNDPHLKDGSLRGVEWATDNLNTPWSGGGGDYAGIDIYSISWGVDIGQPSDGTDQYSRLLDAAVDSGAIVVNAAGNDGPTNDGFTGLSASSKAIIVASTVDHDTMEHEDDVVAWYSSRGPRHDNNDDNPFDELKPDIAAPGTNITQLQPDTTRIIGDASNNGYGNRGSGTSYATPLVVGVIALLLEANPDLEDENEVVKEILMATADRKKAPMMPELDPFWEKDFGYGVTDAYAACRLAEETTDVGAIDPRLQAHITGLETLNSNYTKPFYNYTVPGKFTISGLGYSKGGAYERTEMKIDDGTWIPIEGQSNETFNPWYVEIDDLEKGNHTIWVRSVSGSSQSLLNWVEVVVIETHGKEGELSGGSFILPLIIIGIISMISASVYIYFKRKKETKA